MDSVPAFRLPDQRYESFSWRLQDEHGPSSVPPLLLSQRAHRQLPADSGLPRTLNINGYTYQRLSGPGETGPTGSSFGPPFEPKTVADMEAWRGEWLPQVEKLATALATFEPRSVDPARWESVLDEQTKEYQRIFGGVHRTAAIAVGAVARRFGEAFEARFGVGSRGDFLALLQGFPNCSSGRACALWDLGRLLQSSPDLLQALDRGRSLPDTPAGREFDRRFAEMLKTYGCTTNAELEDMPTWNEDTAIPLALVRAYALQPDDRSPRESAQRQLSKRLEVEGRLRQAAETDDTVKALLPLMEMAQYLVPNQEDHNLLVDQRLAAASRARWLAIGRHLHGKDKLTDPSDVFYLYRPELVSALTHGEVVSEPVIAARKALLRACRQATPPSILGKELPAADSAPVPSVTELKVLRGVPGSAGSFRGTARLIETLEQAGKLKQGDVMVCRATTPSWTPFFGIISGLVTNSGGALSHGALVARELGLPAVVGTVDAMARIPDGAILTVDGTQGVVIIES